jgi:RNA polymerase sigma-70 factor (ECF subfamily)
MLESKDPMASPQSPEFPETHWSLVRRAGAEAPETRGALDDLCRAYWYPVYAFVRRHQPRKSSIDAMDITQEFFTQFIRREDVRCADPHRGRFRSWLIQGLKRFLINQWHYETADKRDCRKLVWLDAAVAEERYRLEPTHDVHPERLYDRDCAIALLGTAFERLQQECSARGWDWFPTAQHVLLPGFDDESYGEIERRLGLSANTLKGKVHWLRHRWRALICEELGSDVRSPAELDEEIDALIRAVQLVEP